MGIGGMFHILFNSDGQDTFGNTGNLRIPV